MLFVIAFLFAGAVYAATLAGRVVAVHDGDTITVLDTSKTQYKIRLAAIDAPELKQAFGSKSKQNLSDLVFDREVTVEWDKRDRNGQIVGKVLYQPVCRPGRMCIMSLSDANYQQIAAGMAWHDKEYEREQSPEDRARYAAAESEARESKAGLWADSDPVPPWDWRKSQQ
jgi:endonuclease YncB( thermonuclease family)